MYPAISILILCMEWLFYLKTGKRKSLFYLYIISSSSLIFDNKLMTFSKYIVNTDLRKCVSDFKIRY